MTTLEHWNSQIAQCFSSFEQFQQLAPQILVKTQTLQPTYWNILLKKTSDLIISKASKSLSRFYALYLLFKIAEKGHTEAGNILAKDQELLTFLYYTAQHEAAKKIALDERGKSFFSLTPTKTEQRIGMNFVRLCLECLITLQRVYGNQDPNNIFNSYHRLLQKQIKLPDYLLFIGRNYSFSQDLATWNYHVRLPVEENSQEDLFKSSRAKLQKGLKIEIQAEKTADSSYDEKYLQSSLKTGLKPTTSTASRKGSENIEYSLADDLKEFAKLIPRSPQSTLKVEFSYANSPSLSTLASSMVGTENSCTPSPLSKNGSSPSIQDSSLRKPSVFKSMKSPIEWVDEDLDENLKNDIDLQKRQTVFSPSANGKSINFNVLAGTPRKIVKFGLIQENYSYGTNK